MTFSEPLAQRGAGRHAERLPERHGDERPDHEDLAVGEVDQLDDAVDERVAERDERPDRPVGETGLDVVQRAGRLVDELDDERRHQQQRQRVGVEDVAHLARGGRR
jgi:hypothetical protein